ncbi:alpha/beta hydrolase [Kineosporia mesophila]|uniref:Alpha/beta hydrolase n=1 Tax=Kineosporia mesophila TaxID=566012 RepID=A0ABP7AAV8_9ACTN|nr:alpha/beta hydrolase [Kineosporia mesophila]
MSNADSVPTVFCLHALGLSARSFGPVASELGSAAHLDAIDLPGFGAAAPLGGAPVASMMDEVVARIRAVGSQRWYLVGHSMGGKIATLIAARALADPASLPGLAGIALLAASPPGPEPMDEEQRARMLRWVRDTGRLSPQAAREFLDENLGAPLPVELDALAMDDLQRASGEAWTGWLSAGNREDWSARVGRLEVPAVVLAGGDDDDLGPDAQRRLHTPVYPDAHFVTLAGAGHMLPLERPRDVADALRDLLNRSSDHGE